MGTDCKAGAEPDLRRQIAHLRQVVAFRPRCPCAERDDSAQCHRPECAWSLPCCAKEVGAAASGDGDLERAAREYASGHVQLMPATTAAAGFIAGAKWAALRKPSGEQEAAVGGRCVCVSADCTHADLETCPACGCEYPADPSAPHAFEMDAEGDCGFCGGRPRDAVHGDVAAKEDAR